jgi:hypothetical protein
MFLSSRWLKALWLQITVKPRKRRPRGKRIFRPNVEELEGRNPPSNLLAGPGTIKLHDGSAVNIQVEDYDWDGRNSGVAQGVTISGVRAGKAHRGNTHHVTPTATDTLNLSADSTDVTVTVGDSTPPPNFNVATGPLLDGTYAVWCNGVGGNNHWLAPDGTSGVKLNSTSSSWILTQLSDPAGCYTIQCQIGPTAYYLQWVNNGNDATNLALVTEQGAGTTWQLDGEQIKAFSDQPAQPNCPFLNGNVSTGTMNMVQSAVDASSWSLGTF